LVRQWKFQKFPLPFYLILVRKILRNPNSSKEKIRLTITMAIDKKVDLMCRLLQPTSRKLSKSSKIFLTFQPRKLKKNRKTKNQNNNQRIF